MNQQKRTNQWKTRHKILLGLLVCALVLSATMQMGSFKAQADTFDETESVSITVNFSDSVKNLKDADPDIPEDKQVVDLDPATCILDVYKIADAVKVEGHDTYEYVKLEGYEALDLEKTKTVDGEEVIDWETIQEDAAKFILGDSFKGKPVVTKGEIGKAIDKDDSGAELLPGLYMVVLRGKTYSGKDYVDTMTRGEGETAETLTVTKAEGRSRIYSFLPGLVSLPDKAPDKDGNKTTLPENGDWIYDQEIELKASYVPKTGGLCIHKSFIGDYFEPCKVTFTLTFDVPDVGYEIADQTYTIEFANAKEAAEGKEIDVVVYDADGEERGIPVYTIVTVKEASASTRFKQVSVTPEKGVVKILADETLKVSFVNTIEEPPESSQPESSVPPESSTPPPPPTPDTGDRANPVPYYVAMGVSGLAIVILAVFLILRKKRSAEEK